MSHGRDYIKSLCREAGLTIREDAAGNTFARWIGQDPNLAPVGTGSHIDAIPNAGRFDGTVGVLGGLEAIRALMRAGYQPRRSIELIVFTSEEPTRFGIGCLGSRLMSGLLDPAVADQLKDRGEISLNQARSAAGFAGPLSAVRLPAECYSAFVELHIEQGPILEQRQNPYRRRHRDRRASQPQNHDRRRRRPCRRGADAGSARCIPCRG